MRAPGKAKGRQTNIRLHGTENFACVMPTAYFSLFTYDTLGLLLAKVSVSASIGVFCSIDKI